MFHREVFTNHDISFLYTAFNFVMKLSFDNLPFSDLSTDDLLIQVVPQHLQLRHWLLDCAAIGLLRHLLEQEASLVVQALHLDLQLVRLSFELLKRQHIQWSTQSVNRSTKLRGQYI